MLTACSVEEFEFDFDMGYSYSKQPAKQHANDAILSAYQPILSCLPAGLAVAWPWPWPTISGLSRGMRPLREARNRYVGRAGTKY